MKILYFIVIKTAMFNLGLVFKSNQLFLFGGIYEDGEKDLTLKGTSTINIYRVIIRMSQKKEIL